MEGKLAETASKRPLALTIGAAAVTLLVILGVLTGPSIVSCFNSTDGMGQCLRGRMVEVGLIPAPPPTAVAEADVAQEPGVAANMATSASSQPEAADEPEVSAEPVLDVAPETEPQADNSSPAPETEEEPAAETPDSDSVAATFGLRAEPDGSVVIAGSGTPGSEVEIFANGELVGSSTVENSGDWVVVPDEPLPAGGVEITVGEAGKSELGEQSVIVVIDEDRASQPLVVASTPGEASRVLQGLTAPEAEADGQVTQAEQPDEPSEVAAAPMPPVSDEPETDLAPATTATASDPAATSTDNGPAPAIAAAEESPAQEEPQSAASPSSQQAEPETGVAAQSPVDNATETSGVQVTPVETPATPPTIDAIEKEGNRTFFAGAGPEDGTVRLYVDDTFIADAPVEDGRWLVEAGPVLDKPNQRVRADLLAQGSAEVAARAEVDFLVELPETDNDIAVAQATDASASEQTQAAPSDPAPASDSIAPASEEEPAPVRADAASTPAVDAPQDTLPTPVEAAPQSQTGVAPEAPSASASPSTATAANDPAAGQPTTADTEIEPEVPTMVGVSLGDPEAQRFASGKAIIRRGDNLWTIARRVYGEGIKYTTIYDANTGQIRNPDRIYPGQVFDLPAGLE